MPITASAKKSLRQGARRNKRNAVYKTKIKKQEKLVLSLIKTNKSNEAKNELKKYYKLIDKAAKTKVLHKNKASRKKSSMAKALNKINAGK